MGLSGERRGSYRRRLRRKYRQLRRRHAPRWWQATESRHGKREQSQWPFADARAGQQRAGHRGPSLAEAGRERPARAAPRARRRQRVALSDVPVPVMAAAGAGAVLVIAVAAGAVGVNRWVAAGDAANTTAAVPAVPSPPAAGNWPTGGPAPSSGQSPAVRRSVAPTRSQPVAAPPPVVVASQLTTRYEGAWPGLGPDWAQPNPRRAMLGAIINGTWSGILQAFLPGPYRSARHPASCRRASYNGASGSCMCPLRERRKFHGRQVPPASSAPVRVASRPAPRSGSGRGGRHAGRVQHRPGAL